MQYKFELFLGSKVRMPKHLHGWAVVSTVPMVYIMTRNALLVCIWAAACDFQKCGILIIVDSGEPVQPLFKLRNSNYVRPVA